jgi:hypothetical protein
MKTRIVATRIPIAERNELFRLCEKFKVKPSDILRTSVIEFCEKVRISEKNGYSCKITTKNYTSHKDKNFRNIKIAKAPIK